MPANAGSAHADSTDGRTPPLDARTGLDKLASYPYQIATWVDDAGYPVSVAVEATIHPTDLTATFDAPAGLDVPTIPTDRPVSLTGSHIRPQPGYGYDERRHVTVWGPASRTGDAAHPDGPPGLGLGRGRGPVLRVLGALGRPVAPLLRCHVGGARDAGQAEALVRVPDPAHDPPAVPHRDDHPGRPRHPHRRQPRLVRPVRRRPDDRRRVVRPARAERRQRRLRHRPGRRRRERHARPSSAAARASSSTGSSACARWRRSPPCSTSWPASSA